jgi:hypothetical protein
MDPAVSDERLRVPKAAGRARAPSLEHLLGVVRAARHDGSHDEWPEPRPKTVLVDTDEQARPTGENHRQRVCHEPGLAPRAVAARGDRPRGGLGAGALLREQEQRSMVT